MERVKMLIRGNLTCKELITNHLGGGGKNNLIVYANESDFDISEAVVIDGDINCDALACNGILAVTGGVCIIGKEG